MKPTTCGPLYQDAITAHAGNDPALYRAFVGGFIGGQAEKVYLGACRAAMFRPSPENLYLVWKLAGDATRRYRLISSMLGDEVWLLRNIGAFELFEELHDMVPNSPIWHAARGQLCGVPLEEIDYRFHERPGAGEPCDRVSTEAHT